MFKGEEIVEHKPHVMCIMQVSWPRRPKLIDTISNRSEHLGTAAYKLWSSEIWVNPARKKEKAITKYWQ